MNRRDVIALALLSLSAGAAAPRLAAAQGRYPERPIKLMVAFSAGGVNDVVARQWAERVKTLLGAVYVENQGGGSGTIATGEVARAPGDGYTILLGSTSTMVLNPMTMAKVPYDPAKDFVPIAILAVSTTSIVVHASVPVKTSKELIAYAKANPGKLSYGSAGNGSITNLAGELFKQRAGGLDIVHVPYKGIGQAVGDLIGGQIPMLSANATAQILDLNRAGKLHILSVNSQNRVRTAPEIPTSIEAGLPGMLAQTTFGVFAPAGTPRPMLERINAVTQEAVADPSFQAELLKLGFEPVLGVGPDHAAGVFQDELVRWTPILKTITTKPQ